MYCYTVINFVEKVQSPISYFMFRFSPKVNYDLPLDTTNLSLIIQLLADTELGCRQSHDEIEAVCHLLSG